MAIALIKLVLLRKLSNNISNECQRLHFYGIFQEILGGRGSIIVPGHYELHLWMLIVPEFCAELPYQSFHI